MLDALLEAVLSMDSYHRGYEAGIEMESAYVGPAFVGPDSSVFGPFPLDPLTRLDRERGFYAVAYYLGRETARGSDTVISFRGTDNFWGADLESLVVYLDTNAFFNRRSGSDIWEGWSVGAGSPTSVQAQTAFAFYRYIASLHSPNVDWADPRSVPISTTGHSLGGGLAGLVAGAYGKKGTLFDHMPFEPALSLTTGLADPDTAPYNPTLSDLLYGNGEFWPENISKIDSYSIAGEFLGAVRALSDEISGGLPVVEYTPPFELGNLLRIDLNPLTPESIQRHSMAVLVLRLFAELRLEDKFWEDSSKHFWPLLFDDDFAKSIGFENAVPGLLNDRALEDDRGWADIMARVLAYSVIETGENSLNARPFGDTGARALFDDAVELGVAINFSSQNLLPEDQLARLFVEYAARLALNKVLSREDDAASNGVLKLEGDATSYLLEVDMSERTWSSAVSHETHGIESRVELISSLLSEQQLFFLDDLADKVGTLRVEDVEKILLDLGTRFNFGNGYYPWALYAANQRFLVGSDINNTIHLNANTIAIVNGGGGYDSVHCSLASSVL
ncbi:MAG: hypothetical protein AAGB46_06035, partial [Verrucomicrobiota bacterium]